MILLEFVYGIFKPFSRFCIWFVTARDCKHCTYGTFTKWGWMCAMEDLGKRRKCRNTLRRCYFERQRKGGAE